MADTYYPASKRYALREAETRKTNIIEYIVNNPGLDSVTIGRNLGLNNRTVRDYLSQLQEKGKIHSTMNFDNHALFQWYKTDDGEK